MENAGRKEDERNRREMTGTELKGEAQAASSSVLAPSSRGARSRNLAFTIGPSTYYCTLEGELESSKYQLFEG